MDKKNYDFISNYYSLRVAEEPLSEILPSADVFLSSYSSTIPWAVLCRIPSVIVDFIHSDYQYFNYSGVNIVQEKASLKMELNKLLSDNIYYKTLQKKQKESLSRISPFDGKCLERISDISVNPDKYLNLRMN